MATEEVGALFHIGPIEVNSVMVTTTAITVALCLVGVLATRKLRKDPEAYKKVPAGLQNFTEKCVDMLDNFICDITGRSVGRQYLPFLATLFIFILVSNYSGLLPLAGILPGLAAPTSALSVTIALALCTFIMTHFAGIRAHGLHYFGHFFKPVAFIFPLMILDELVRPVALSLRLFGNIFGEETVAHEFFNMVPFLVPVAMNALGLLMGLIQAVVFVLLASIYIEGAAGEGH